LYLVKQLSRISSEIRNEILIPAKQIRTLRKNEFIAWVKWFLCAARDSPVANLKVQNINTYENSPLQIRIMRKSDVLKSAPCMGCMVRVKRA